MISAHVIQHDGVVVNDANNNNANNNANNSVVNNNNATNNNDTNNNVTNNNNTNKEKWYAHAGSATLRMLGKIWLVTAGFVVFGIIGVSLQPGGETKPFRFFRGDKEWWDEIRDDDE